MTSFAGIDLSELRVIQKVRVLRGNGQDVGPFAPPIVDGEDAVIAPDAGDDEWANAEPALYDPVSLCNNGCTGRIILL